MKILYQAKITFVLDSESEVDNAFRNEIICAVDNVLQKHNSKLQGCAIKCVNPDNDVPLKY